MNERTMKCLDECLKTAFEDMKRNKNNPEYQKRIRKIINEGKHYASMYFGRIDEGQKRACSLFSNKVYFTGVN